MVFARFESMQIYLRNMDYIACSFLSFFFLILFWSSSDFLERLYVVQFYLLPVSFFFFLVIAKCIVCGIRVSAELLLHFYCVAPIRLWKTIKKKHHKNGENRNKIRKRKKKLLHIVSVTYEKQTIEKHSRQHSIQKTAQKKKYEKIESDATVICNAYNERNPSAGLYYSSMCKCMFNVKEFLWFCLWGRRQKNNSYERYRMVNGAQCHATKDKLLLRHNSNVNWEENQWKRDQWRIFCPRFFRVVDTAQRSKKATKEKKNVCGTRCAQTNDWCVRINIIY